MLDLNAVHITGRLVREVEVHNNSNGSPFVWFTLAVNSHKDQKGNAVCDFLNCSIWGKPAELLAMLCKKGDRLLITRGALRSFSKADEDGTKRSYTYVLISGYEIIDSRRKASRDSAMDFFGDEELEA